jgi:predicted AlkP superfamily pyrophosphatase or phosphodiesterase
MRSERGARVVTLSLKDRSAIMMAGRAGHAVTWLDVAGDRWVTSSAFTDAPLPQVKAFIDAHPIEADYGKTWKKLLPPASYRQTDDSNEEAPPPGWSRSFPHVLNGAGKGPDFDFYYQWQRSPFANDYLAELAMSLVDSMQLGQREATDVLGISFSATDLVGHAFGPSSHEVQDVYAHLDQTIGSLLTRLDAVVGPDRYVVALSADHGVTPIPEQLTRSGENAGRFDVTRLTSAITARMQAIFGSGRHLAQVNGNDVYFAPGIYEKLTANPKAHAALLGDVKTVDGIADVYPADLLRRSATASDSMLRAAALSYFPGRSGDLVVALKPGWMSMASGTTHGSRNPDDQRVPLLFYGSGVRRGVHDDAATPADIAPTLSALCGLTMPKVEGRVLRAALNERRN